ncbi:hypothetical protein ABZ719_23470 [Streptomyces sp. NPDC006743]|uniref:hypothetical protein n=1 Tax=Streptomyces sp. NPDC006743 TaxID=3154480 RepID=UPI003453843C
MSFGIVRPGSAGLWKDLRHHPGDGHFGGPGGDHDGDFGGHGPPGRGRPSGPCDGPRPGGPPDSCPPDDDVVAGPFRVVRPSDMLVLDISLVNLRFDGHRLVRADPAAPTLVVVTLPPQHVLEQSFEQLPAAGTASAVTAGTSTLSFSVPATLEGLELSLESLLDWSRLVPMTVPVGQTQPDPGGPALFQGLPRSVIEFPTRLLITYDEPVDWVGRTGPEQADGRTALWHARLHGSQEGPVLLRAFAAAGSRGDLPAGSPLTAEDLADIVTLTSRNEQVVPGGPPPEIPSAPLRSDQFIVTPLGSSAHLHGTWPPVPASNGLEAYDHITGLGRDQFVRVVRHGRLSTGHEASHVKEFKRVFAVHPDGGIVAFLRREDRVIIKQPEVRYGQGGYTHGGREMPFRTLRITDRATPPIKPPVPPSLEEKNKPLKDSTAFWVVLQNPEADHEFTLIGTDSEGRNVSFTMPLVFVPDGLPDPDGNFRGVYGQTDPRAGAVPNRRVRELHGQTMAMAQPPAEAPGSTAHAVETLTFGLGTTDDDGKETHPAVGLPHVSGGTVRVPAAEQFLPKAEALPVTFDTTYLVHGMDSHPAGAYLKLAEALPLTLGAEKAGGLASPQTALRLITSQAGVVPDVFAAGATDARQLIQTAFGGAKLLGLIDLPQVMSDIVKEDLGQLRQLGDDQIDAILKDSQRMLPAPVLRIRDLADGQGKELRYVWKTKLAKPDSAREDDPTHFLVVTGATLTLDARTTRSKDAVDNATVTGELTNFGLDFGDIEVDIADLKFRTGPGRKPDVTASGLAVKFRNDLEFVNTLRSALPSDLIGPGAYVDVRPAGIVAGYRLGLPSIALGALSLTNLTLTAELTIPLDSSPVSFRFSVSEQQHPFNVTVSLFGGGGYFSMCVDVKDGLREIEGALEFGGGAAIDVGVAAGGVTIMAGVRFKVAGPRNVQLSGYLRFHGFLSVLGIVTVSVDFYVELSYTNDHGRTVIRGSGSLTVSVRIAFFSKSVSIPFERSFSGSPADPSFALCMPKDPHWRAYCEAYAR